MLNGAVTSGGVYVFSFYSSALKEQFKLTQDELETIGFSPFLGSLFSFLAGMFGDHAGPAAATAFGGTVITTSLILQWLT